MKTLILGGAGFIGKHLSTTLVLAGHRVISFDLPPERDRWPDIPDVEWLAGNVEDSSVVAAAMRGVDVVVHLAGASNPKASNENPLSDVQHHVMTTLCVLEAIVKQPRQPRFIFPSSGGTVYGIPRYLPIPETHPTDPICAYGIGKLSIEKYLALYGRLYGLDYRILRLANPYGHYQPHTTGQGVISTFLHKALSDQSLEIWGDGQVIRDYIFIDDTVSAILAAVDHQGDDRVINVGSGIGHSLLDIIQIMQNIIGREVRYQCKPHRSCDVPVNILDIHRARMSLGWTPRIALEQGIERIWEYLTIGADAISGAIPKNR